MKKFFKQLLRLAGYEIRPHRRELPLSGPLRFGPYKIQTDNQALLRSYRDYPETNRVIFRLVSFLAARGAGAFIDVGANCGDSTALAKWAAQDWPALCIEGDPTLIGLIQRNLASVPEVEIKALYLGEAPGQIAVSIEKEGWNNTLKPDGASGGHTQLALTTLDDAVVDWAPRARTRLVKIDTEGYDAAILRGGRQLLADAHPAVLFEHNREALRDIGRDEWPVFAYLRDLGYATALFYDAFGRFLLAASLADEKLLRDLHDYADGVHGKVYYYDIVCFHASDRASAEEFLTREREHRSAVSASA